MLFNSVSKPSTDGSVVLKSLNPEGHSSRSFDQVSDSLKYRSNITERHGEGRWDSLIYRLSIACLNMFYF